MRIFVLIFMGICFHIEGMNERLCVIINSSPNTIKVVPDAFDFFKNKNVKYEKDTFSSGADVLIWDRDETCSLKEFEVKPQKFKIGYLKNENQCGVLDFYNDDDLIGTFYIEKPLNCSSFKKNEKVEFCVNEEANMVLRHIWWLPHNAIIIKILKHDPNYKYPNNETPEYIDRHKGPVYSEKLQPTPTENGCNLDQILKSLTPEDPPPVSETSIPERGCCRIS